MIAGRFLLAFALAFIAESMSEYLFAPWLDAAKARWPGLKAAEPMRYVALLVGLALALAYRLDVIYEAFGYVAIWPWVGVVITGLVIGRGSNYLHDFWETYLKPPQ
jgi:hypothetical protein